MANFPKDFLWGTATASFQVEGHLKDDGAGDSNWLTYCHEPGRVVNDDVPMVGPDALADHLVRDVVPGVAAVVEGLGGFADRALGRGVLAHVEEELLAAALGEQVGGVEEEQ